jgi:hypothetical protein
VTFADWYSSTIEPGVIQIANQIPDAAKRALILENSRESMAACWNAALDAAFAEIVVLRYDAEGRRYPEGVGVAVVYGGKLTDLQVKP